ncbi:MAG: DUF3368 domain-containing protein [Sedimenticola sp.]
MTLLISDSNILIDMADGGLLEGMFRLQETFAVPDVLYVEELRAQHPELPDLGLVCMTLEGEGVMEAYRLKSLCTGRTAPSQNDLFALLLAKQEECPLLTGDKRLRTLAEKGHKDVELRGTLWLVEQMVVEKIITIAEARIAYARMREAGSRPPTKSSIGSTASPLLDDRWATSPLPM